MGRLEDPGGQQNLLVLIAHSRVPISFQTTPMVSIWYHFRVILWTLFHSTQPFRLGYDNHHCFASLFENWNLSTGKVLFTRERRKHGLEVKNMQGMSKKTNRHDFTSGYQDTMTEWNHSKTCCHNIELFSGSSNCLHPCTKFGSSRKFQGPVIIRLEKKVQGNS